MDKGNLIVICYYELAPGIHNTDFDFLVIAFPYVLVRHLQEKICVRLSCNVQSNVGRQMAKIPIASLVSRTLSV